MKLRARGHVLSLEQPAVMGVLNVTPDSFSDGGRWLEPDSAIAHAREMVRQGAAIVDVGGESTRPGAEPVPEEDELRRVIPVIEALAADGIVTSIDTRKASVAAAAVEAGAAIVNDTNGEQRDDEMAEIISTTGVAAVLMHSRGTPATMRSLTDYSDVVGDVCAYLAGWAADLERSGVPRGSIVLDPGFGFAKTPDQNLELLNRLDEVVGLGYPVLAGTSRKSFIGAVLDLPEDQRVEGTAATVVWALIKGAQIVRVHDVEQIMRVVRMSSAIAAAKVDIE